MRWATLGGLIVLAAGAPASAADLKPLVEISGEAAAKAVKTGISATPFKPLVTVSEGIDLGRKGGVRALEREDAIREQQMILVKAHSGILKGLAAQDIDLNADARARKAKAHLARLGVNMSADGLTSIQYMLAITARHLPYAVARVAYDKAIGSVLSAALARIRLAAWVKAKLPRMTWVAGRVHGDGVFRKVLKPLGWSRFADREAAANKMARGFTDKMLDKAADKIFDAQLGQAKADIFDRIYATLVDEGRVQPIAHFRVRLAITRLDVIVPAPVVARPMPTQGTRPAPVIGVPVAQVDVSGATVRSDPLQAGLANEDRQIRTYSAASRDDRQADAPAAPAPTIAEPPSSWRLQMDQAWRCAGAGAKTGCGDESWNGDRRGLKE